MYALQEHEGLADGRIHAAPFRRQALIVVRPRGSVRLAVANPKGEMLSALADPTMACRNNPEMRL